jgi:hypothetical protein
VIGSSNSTLLIKSQNTPQGITDNVMAAYLKIENIGVAPEEGFTVFGVSLADTSRSNGVIGQFGSGNKHGVAVLLRNELSPVVFAGNLKLEFSTRPQTVSDTQATKEFSRVVVKYGGIDLTGASRSSTEDLGFVLDYGKQDWSEVALALREFVSNAIDRSIREIGDWSSVKIEIVDESQVRAKRDHTRVFVPMNAEVLQFYNDLGKWFLHFGEPQLLDKAILPKANRNLGDRRAAVIYRRGVRVREFESSDTESLFDYNLSDLAIDESRKASDWDVRHHAGKALANGDKATLAVLFDRLLNSDKHVWEFGFDIYSLQPSYGDSETVAQRQKNWQDAFIQVAGDHAVLTGKGSVNQLERKGFTPILAPENLVSAAAAYGLQTSASVLSADELSGREITEATPDAQAAVDLVWDLLTEIGLTNGKEKPPVRSFTSILDGGTMLNGYYRDGVVFINRDLAGDASAMVGRQALSDRLLKVALEEVAHYVTQATDNSRDFQDYLLEVAVKLARKCEEVAA